MASGRRTHPLPFPHGRRRGHRRVLVDPSRRPPTPPSGSEAVAVSHSHKPGGPISREPIARRRPRETGTITPVSPAYWSSALGTAAQCHPFLTDIGDALAGLTLYKSGRQVAADNRRKGHRDRSRSRAREGAQPAARPPDLVPAPLRRGGQRVWGARTRGVGLGSPRTARHDCSTRGQAGKTCLGRSSRKGGQLATGHARTHARTPTRARPRTHAHARAAAGSGRGREIPRRGAWVAQSLSVCLRLGS